jgi:hypothetical protein
MPIPVPTGKREDEWAHEYPPTGTIWKCWKCSNQGFTTDVTNITFDGWPIFGDGWYYAGPFLTESEATSWEWDGTNPCANFSANGIPQLNSASSDQGGGSGGSGRYGGGARFYFPNPPYLRPSLGIGTSDCCNGSTSVVNGQPNQASMQFTDHDNLPGSSSGEVSSMTSADLALSFTSAVTLQIPFI